MRRTSDGRRIFDQEIEDLSNQQKELRQRILISTVSEQTDNLKTERNRLLHEIRNKIKDNRDRGLIEKLNNINRLKGDKVISGDLFYRLFRTCTKNFAWKIK